MLGLESYDLFSSPAPSGRRAITPAVSKCHFMFGLKARFIVVTLSEVVVHCSNATVNAVRDFTRSKSS
ncbi:hypothetical protein GCM10017709_14950 [Glutamicibacter nicotianae]